MVVLVLLIGLVCAPYPLTGQLSWWSEREEPEMLNVTGTLANPEGVSVEFRNPVTQNVRRLMGWEAMVFLQMRNYIVFNEQARHFQVTGKYNDWKNRPKPGIVQPPVNVPQLQGMPVPLGSTSTAPAQKWQVDAVRTRLWDLYKQVWKPYYDTPPPPKFYGAYAIDVARTIDYHLSTLGTEAQLAWVEPVPDLHAQLRYAEQALHECCASGLHLEMPLTVGSGGASEDRRGVFAAAALVFGSAAAGAEGVARGLVGGWGFYGFISFFLC